MLIKIDNLQTQMYRGFRIVIDTIENTKTQEIITKIKTSVKYFEETRELLNRYRKKEYIEELSSKNSVLRKLEEYSDPVNSLYSALNELIHNENNYAIPKNEADDKAFQALFALFYGTQTYFLVKVFLMKQYAYIANYNYEIGNFDTFNTQYVNIKSLSTKFKNSLFADVTNIIKQVKNKNLLSKVQNEWYKDISEDVLLDLKNDIEAIDLNMIDVNGIVEVKDVDFAAPEITSQYGDWKDKRQVSYAVQLRDENKYSTFSSWSKPEEIGNKANPTITVPQDNNGRERLIFRKIDNGSTQFVGVVKKTETKFRDIDRDLYNAAGRGDQDLAYSEMQLLLDKGADIDAVFDQGQTLIHAAAMKGNDRVAKDFLFGKIDINSKDKKGYTPMHIAAESNQKEFVQELIKLGADVNAQTETNQLTPLHIAAMNGYLETVSELIKSPVISVNAADKFGFTALHHATHKRGNAKIVKALLTNDGTSISAKTKLDLTPLHLVSINGFPKVLEALVENSKLLDINEANNDGMTALHFAAMYGKSVIVRKLLIVANIGINNLTVKNQWTPLHFAIYFKKGNVASQLLSDERTQFNLAGGNGVTPLHLAIAAGQLQTAENLIKKGADKEAKITNDGSTAVHLAMKRRKPDALELLIHKEANLNAQTEDGTTALHLACKYHKLDFLNLLLDADVDTKIADKNGILAIQTAIDNMDLRFVRAIVEKNPSIVSDQLGSMSVKEGIYVRALAHEKVFRLMYQYLKNKDSKENQRKYYGLEPLEVFKQLGINELWGIIFNPNNDPNENNDNYHKRIKFLYETVILPCIAEESKGTPCKYSAPLNSRFTRSIKLNARHEYLEQVPPFSKTPQARISNQKDSNLISLEPSMHRNAFSNSANFLLQNFNANSVLLLLDLVVRKLKNEKYPISYKEDDSKLKSRGLALNITEKFEKFVNALGRIPTKERMNLAEVSSKIYKALVGENESKVVEILCSYVKGYLKSEEITNMMSALPLGSSSLQKETIEDALYSLTASCISDQI
ncbi:delta-latroinsectotoxin-Lt1a-like [Parasteatoda tepidariorum]